MMQRQTEFTDPVSFFDHTLQKGSLNPVPGIGKCDHEEQIRTFPFDPQSFKTEGSKDKNSIEVILYETVTVGEGGRQITPGSRNYPIR